MDERMDNGGRRVREGGDTCIWKERGKCIDGRMDRGMGGEMNR